MYTEASERTRRATQVLDTLNELIKRDQFDALSAVLE